MDLIKLKHGEEAEFEEELNGNPLAKIDRDNAVKLASKKSSGWKSGKAAPAQRLSALRISQGKIYV